MIISRYAFFPRSYLPWVVSSILLASVVLMPFITKAQTLPADVDTMNRLANFTHVGVSVHTLVKLPSDGDSMTQADSAVYYLGDDGRRHAFPNSNVYASWYEGFSNVRTVNGTDLASIPLGENVIYRPGVKLVKFLSIPNVYVVSGDRSLRWIKSESLAQDLYGMNWRTMVDDIEDTFYMDYRMNLGDVVQSTSDYSPATMRATYTYPSQVL